MLGQRAEAWVSLGKGHRWEWCTVKAEAASHAGERLGSRWEKGQKSLRAEAPVRGGGKPLPGQGETSLWAEAPLRRVREQRPHLTGEGKRPSRRQDYEASTPRSSRPPSRRPPSGWDAETGGGETEDGLRPDVLVSLTAPKRCAGRFSGRHHFVAGRFVPDDVRRKFALRLPGYTGTDCVVAL